MTDGIVLSKETFDEMQEAVAFYKRMKNSPAFTQAPQPRQVLGAPPGWDMWLGMVQQFDGDGNDMYTNPPENNRYWISSVFYPAFFNPQTKFKYCHRPDDPKYKAVYAVNLCEAPNGIVGERKRILPGTLVMVYSIRWDVDQTPYHVFFMTPNPAFTQASPANITLDTEPAHAWYRDQTAGAPATPDREYEFYKNNAKETLTYPNSDNFPQPQGALVDMITRIRAHDGVNPVSIRKRSFNIDNTGSTRALAIEQSAFETTNLTVITAIRDNAGTIEYKTTDLDVMYKGTESGWNPT